MKFDKSKILTAVTADQAKVGQKGWVADNLTDLFRRVSECHPITIASITSESMEKRFIANANTNSLFYPAPEPTYRPFNDHEMEELIGETIRGIDDGRKNLILHTVTCDRNELCVKIAGQDYQLSAKELLERYTHHGMPCGIKE